MPGLESHTFIEPVAIEKSRVTTQIEARLPKYHELLDNAHILMTHQEYEHAIELLKSAIELDEVSDEAYISLGQCYMELKYYSDAADVFRALTEFSENEISFTMLATAYYHNGDDFRALESYLKALNYTTSEASFLFDIYKNLGNIFLRLGDTFAAEENFNKAYRIDPNSDVLLVNYGTLEIQRNNLNEALTYYRQALDINTNNDKAWIGLALIHHSFGDLDLSWGNLERALQIDIKNEVAFQLMLDWGMKEGRISSITRICDERINKYTHDLQFLLIYSETLIKLAMYKKAIEVVKLAYELDSENSDVLNLKKVIKEKLK